MGEFILASFMILILLLINWFPKTNRMEIESYDWEKMDDRNPLYRKNYRFRTARKKKRGSIFTADLKLDYYCQVMGAVQIILCIVYILYGIFSDDAETSTKIGRILFYWFCLHVFITVVVEEYYGVIFKSAYQSAPWKKWRPFEYIGNFTLGPDTVRNDLFKDLILMVMLMWIPGMVQNALQDGYERILKTGLQKKHKQKVWKAFSVEGREETVKKIQLENISSQDIEKQIEKLCSKNGYLLWEAYEKVRTKAKLFFREQENRLDIFLHVKSNEENIIGFCEEMNVAVQYFLKEYYSAKLNHPLLNLEALIYAKEAEAFHSLLAHTQTSTSGAAQVLTVFSLKEKAFYISGWKKYIEKIGDGSFLQMLFKVLEINVK